MKTNEGLIMRVVLIIIAIVALKYFLHFDLIAWINSEAGQKVIQPIWNLIKSFYFWVENFFRSHF